MAHITGFPVVEVAYTCFSDGEIELNKSNIALVAYDHAVIMHAAGESVHDNFMWLIFVVQTLKVAQVQKITVCMPYAFYARQPDALQTILNIFASLGVSQCIAVELHELVHAVVDDLTVTNVCLDAWIVQWIQHQYQKGQVTIVAPDQGALARATYIAGQLQAPLMVCTKKRYEHNKTTVLQVQGVCKTPYALIVDDIIDTGSTIQGVARILSDEYNIDAIDAFAVHGRLSGDALNVLQQGLLRKITVTNTIEQVMLPPKFQVLDVTDYAIPSIIKVLIKLA